MTVGEHCSPTCKTVRPDETVRAAARCMDQEGVGCVVVVDDAGRPVGILSDRDVAMRVLRRGKDPDATSVASVMEEDVVCLRRGAGLLHAFRRIRSEGLRRLPVVDEDGCAVGVFSADDALRVIASDLGLAADVAAAQSPAGGKPAAEETPR
jgi:CBS domain-containing protein